MLSEAGAASGPGLPWEHPPELLSLLGLPAPFLELFPLYGDRSTPSCVYLKVTDHRVGPNSRRGVCLHWDEISFKIQPEAAVHVMDTAGSLYP